MGGLLISNNLDVPFFHFDPVFSISPTPYKQLTTSTNGGRSISSRNKVEELKESNDNALIIDVNGTTLHFTIREFALVTGLKCIGDLYECCSNVDPEIAIRVGNRIPEILNWKVIDDRPFYEYLMEGMFNGEENPLIFKNIASSHRELLVLQIPPPDVSLVQDRLSTANVEGDYNDFSSTPPPYVVKMKNQHVDVSALLLNKKQKQQPIAPQDAKNLIKRSVVSPPEKNQYLWSVEPLPVNTENKSHIVSIKKPDPTNDKSDELSLSREDLDSFNKSGDDGERQNEDDMHEDSENKVHLHTTHVAFPEAVATKLHVDVPENRVSCGNSNENILKNPTEKIEEGGDFSRGQTDSKVVFPVALKADNNDEHISKEKQHASRFELTDEEHPTIIQETKIVIHQATKVDDATPIQKQRSRHPGPYNCSPYLSKFGSASECLIGGVDISAEYFDVGLLHTRYIWGTIMGLRYAEAIR
ncbi:hypothetical protein HAX54_020098 [Datura stramonium]|uniref:DUF1985 domain-containing protein n=1 Tax=Datura stramonium TaxID=4076 RepID=A0ABS8UST3_DATST|nr:hypothetical protein [Datura stramonium]